MGCVLKIELEGALSLLTQKATSQAHKGTLCLFPTKQDSSIFFFKLQLVCSPPGELLHEHLHLLKYVLAGCGPSDLAEPEQSWTPSSCAALLFGVSPLEHGSQVSTNLLMCS